MYSYSFLLIFQYPISNFQWFTFLQTFNAWIAHIHIVTTEKNTTSAIIEARGVGYNPSRWRMKKKHKRQIILPRILSKLSVGFVLSMTRKRRRGLSSSSSFLLDLMINVFPSRWDLQFLHKWLQNVHVMFFSRVKFTCSTKFWNQMWPKPKCMTLQPRILSKV